MIRRSTLPTLRLNQNYFTSQTFSSVGIHEVAKWQFCSTTHVPSLIAFSIMRMAIGPCPWPSDNELNFDPLKPCDDKEDKTVIQIYSLLQLIIHTLSFAEVSLCHKETGERKKRKRAGGDGKGRREEEPSFPSFHRPSRAKYFLLLK